MKHSPPLPENKNFFNKILARVPGVLYQFRLYPDGRSCFPFASESIKSIYEVSPEEIREDASAVFALLHPEDYDGVVASIHESARTLKIWRHDYRVVLPKQGVCWRSGEAQPEKLEDGSVLWHGFITDITDRKKIEESLRLAQFSIDNSQDAIFSINWESEIVYVNAAACQHLGYTEDELLHMTIPDIDPDYKQEVWFSHREELVKSGSIRFETRHIRKDGSIIPVEVVNSAMNYNGKLYFFASVRNIHDRKQYEENLNLLKSRLHFLLNSSPAVIYSCKAYDDFGATYISENVTSQLGYHPNEFTEDSSFWLNHIHPDDQPNVLINLPHLFEAGVHKHQYRFLNKSGEYIWMQDEAILIKDIHGNPKEIVGYWIDINEQKLAEEKVYRVTNLYRALSEVNQAIVRIEDQTELFPLVCKCAVDFGGMDMAFIGQVNEKADRFIPVASYGSNTSYLDGIFISPNADLPEGRGPLGIAFRENHSVIIQNYSSAILTSPWHERAYNNNWNSAAAFPIQRGGKPFAVLSVYHCSVSAFDLEAVALLEEMSADISFALDNFDREVKRIESEEHLRLAASVFDGSAEGIMITDQNNSIVAVNKAFSSITGFSEAEVKGKNPKILKSGRQDKDFFKTFWHTLNTTGQWQGEIWNKRKNGTVFPSWMTINTIYNKNGYIQKRVCMLIDISQRKEADEMIWKQANFDFLTGLPNRQMFYDRLDQDMKKAQRSARPMALLFIDLDRFKEVNDTLGHDMGDIMLKETTTRLLSCVRETDTVARLGGDEFTVILSEIDYLGSIELITQSILAKLSEPYYLMSEVAYVSASIGITLYPEDATSVEVLLKNADQAMYAAKSKGRNCYSYFTPAMQLAVQARVQIANDLRSALSNEQFRIVYQPIVELATGDVRKAEALIRWQHPLNGLVSPADFIPIAEETGAILEIGEWVFHEAVKQAKIWRELIHPEFQISINKSPVQFHREDKSLQKWRDYLNAHEMPGTCISVEITEGLLLDANTHVTEQLLEFRDAGIQVSIDDFGTGYSALSYLIKFDIDYLKIDRSFIKNLKIGTGDFTLCEAIIEMAHKLNIKVIAEGVETQEQCTLLKQIGCDYGQGFLWSKPATPSEFETIILKK